jgi:hypothetical protein
MSSLCYESQVSCSSSSDIQCTSTFNARVFLFCCYCCRSFVRSFVRSFFPPCLGPCFGTTPGDRKSPDLMLCSCRWNLSLVFWSNSSSLAVGGFVSGAQQKFFGRAREVINVTSKDSCQLMHGSKDVGYLYFVGFKFPRHIIHTLVVVVFVVL